MISRLERLSYAWQNLSLGSPLWCFDTIASTNEALKLKAEQNAPEGCVVMANAQTAGRGRAGRSWISLPGLGLYLSVLLRPDWPVVDSGIAATIGSLAVARALIKLNIRNITLKWPNDVFAGDHKIAGVLAEPRIAKDKIAFIVLGIGINVGHDADALKGPLNNRATSCRLQGSNVTVEDVALALMPEMASIYAQARKGETDKFFAEWLEFRGQP